MTYEWDEAKREANIKKHGLDFFVAHRIYESPDKWTSSLPNRFESRLRDVALLELNGTMLALVYTIRDGAVRFISFRPASRKERRAYAAAKSRYERLE